MPKILAFTKARKNSSIAAASAASDAPPARVQQTEAQPAVLPPQEESIRVSVVVPTCGQPELLSRCLAALILQRFDAGRFEIIVVDDQPGERTRQVVQDWAAHGTLRGPKVIYVPSAEPRGPAAARNTGWRMARGDIVAFTNDDTVARTTWLDEGVRAFGDGEVDAVWGRIVMPLHRTPTDYELDAKGLERAEFVTANCFCRKNALERAGGFDERFRSGWREDADLYFSLLDQGARVEHAAQAVIVHPIRPARWGVSLSQQKKLQYDALLYKKHPQLYRRKIRSGARREDYLIVLAMLAIPGAILAGHSMLAAGAALAWLGLTARLCLARLRPTVRTPGHIGEMIVTSALIPPLAVYWRIAGALRFRAPLF